MLIRDGGLCQVRDPRCTGVATTAHHTRPTSQDPELFWNPEYLQASCGPCNRHGAVTASENRANRQTTGRFAQ